jgi:hypothetical protein
MGRLCERPGCSEEASIAYGFDVDRLLVWLAIRDPDGDPMRAGSLCLRHANSMVVPQGWTLDDRRERTRHPVSEELDANGGPWMPAFDEQDDLGGVLAADSPLLAKAFRGTDRPR